MLAAKVVGLEHVRDVVIRGVAHDDGSKHGEFGIFINQRVHEAERYRRRVSSALGIEDFNSGPDTRTPCGIPPSRQRSGTSPANRRSAPESRPMLSFYRRWET